MRHHKLALTCATALLAISTFHPAAAGQAGAPAGQGLPSLTDGDRTFLSRLARRTVRDAMLGRPTYEPAYVPASLKDVSSQAVVRLRERGYLHDSGASGVAPIAQATRDAAIAAVAHLAEERKGDVTLANQLLIEIEIVGTPEPIEVEADWTAPGAVDPHIEPGVHGFMISAPQASFRFCPTEIYMTDMIVEEALTEIAKQVASSRAKVADIKLYRFRTLHWYEPNNGADIVALHRGLTVVPQSDVRAETLREHIDRLADYIAYRQLESGLFSYQYECGRDRYTPDDNLVRQAGTVSAMAWHASFTGRSASRAAADLGLRRLLSWKVDVTDPEGLRRRAGAVHHGHAQPAAALRPVRYGVSAGSGLRRAGLLPRRGAAGDGAALRAEAGCPRARGVRSGAGLLSRTIPREPQPGVHALAGAGLFRDRG
jgi:AMMECR1 domain-containing protein